VVLYRFNADDTEILKNIPAGWSSTHPNIIGAMHMHYHGCIFYTRARPLYFLHTCKTIYKTVTIIKKKQVTVQRVVSAVY
jgi:hypothetical protein